MSSSLSNSDLRGLANFLDVYCSGQPWMYDLDPNTILRNRQELGSNDHQFAY